MALSLFLPLDALKPSQLLAQYSEWIYFTLVLIFFISVAGIGLRNHFNKPYVKPLIISVGLMMTVGIFKYKIWLVRIFEGWGILGGLLLVFMAAFIPYAMARNFGVSAGKAFYLAYILFYILSWTRYSEIYQQLGEMNLGLVNLGLLILFFVAVFKVAWPRSSSSEVFKDIANNSPMRPEIDREQAREEMEQKVVKTEVQGITEREIKSAEDMDKALAEMQTFITKYPVNMPQEEREKMARMLQSALNNEQIFKVGQLRLQKIFERLVVIDAQQLQEKRARLNQVSGKEREILKAEIAQEQEKITIEQTVRELEARLNQNLKNLDGSIQTALEFLRRSRYPREAQPSLTQARQTLKGMITIIKSMKDLEDRLIQLVKAARSALAAESKAA